MDNNKESLLSAFFEIHYLQVIGKKGEALHLLRSTIKGHSTCLIEHTLWVWLLSEHILRFKEDNLLSEFNDFISDCVDLIEKNWNVPQKHIYLSLKDDCFTIHLAIYYASLVNLRNLGYRPGIQQTATAIRDQVFKKQLKGGMVICSPNHPFASTDLLLSVLPFGLFSPEDLVMVEAVKEMEHTLVQHEKVLESPKSSEHSNLSTALLSLYFLEKGDIAKSNDYRKLIKDYSQLATSYFEKLIDYYRSRQKIGFPVTHEPFGNGNKYEPQVYERFPQIPIENEEVIIQFTAPYSKGTSAFVHINSKITTRVVEAIYISEEKPYWKANIGGFYAHEEVSYYIEWKEDGKSVLSSTYNFYPLEIVDIWELLGCKGNDTTYLWWSGSGKISFVLCLDTDQKTMCFQRDKMRNENATFTDINDILSKEGLPKFYIKRNHAPIRLFLDRFGNWQDLSIRFFSPANERFFGMGERYHQLEYRGEELDCYVYNQYRDQSARTYLPIPFFISSLQYGFHVKTSGYTRFNFAKTNDEVLDISISLNQEEKTSIQFFTGTPLDIVSTFTKRTGSAEMLPVWAFGPWMSSNNWDRDEVVREQVRKTTELQIPATVLVLEQWSDETTYYIFNDAIYEPTDGSFALSYEEYTYPEWGRWPNPKELVDYINKQGMEVILWQIPIIKYLNRQHHPQKDNDEAHMIKKNYFIKDFNNKPYRIPEGWFKESLLMDFSNPEGVKWWFEKRKYLLDIGIAGFKTDGGEMVFGDHLQFADGRMGSNMRNEYPNDYIKA
jgi:hypothetical protein